MAYREDFQNHPPLTVGRQKLLNSIKFLISHKKNDLLLPKFNTALKL